MRICFYAAVRDPALFELIDFYRQDVVALRSLGHDVRLVNTPGGLREGADLYWVWWQTSGLPALLAARARRRPSVLVTALSANDTSAAGLDAKPAYARAASRLGLALPDLVLADSDDTYRGLLPFRTRRLEMVPHAVDTEYFTPSAEPRRERIVTISQLTLGNVDRKRLLDVVRTAALVPEYEFLLVGPRGDGAERIEAEIARLGVGDRVRLTGEVELSEKRRLLRSAIAYLQPTHYEAFGLAIAEAMACGTPVVSNRVGNVPDLVGDTGELEPPSAPPEALAAALRRLLADPDLEARRARTRERVATEFSVAQRTAGIERALAAVSR